MLRNIRRRLLKKMVRPIPIASILLIAGVITTIAVTASHKPQPVQITETGHQSTNKQQVISNPQSQPTVATPTVTVPKISTAPVTPVPQNVINNSTLATECDNAQESYEQSVTSNQNSVYSQIQAIQAQAKADDESVVIAANQQNAVYSSNNPTLEQYYSSYTSAVSAIPGCFATQQEVTYTLLPVPTLSEPLPGYPNL